MSTTSWIKMATGLRRHPKVTRMAGLLKTDRLRVVGALHAVWSVFDEHSPDGLLPYYTLALLDEEIGLKGFGAAMANVGWIEETAAGLIVPDYEAHNGPTAKRRAQDTKAKSGRRAGGQKPDKRPPPQPPDAGHLSASDADKLRTDCGQDADQRREEKSREELSTEAEERGSSASPAAQVCLALKAAGIQAVQSQHPTLLALLAAGAQVDEFVEAVPLAAGRRDPFTYLLGVVAGRREDAAKLAQGLHQGPPPTATGKPLPEWKANQLQGAAILTGAPPASVPPAPPSPETIDVEARILPA